MTVKVFPMNSCRSCIALAAPVKQCTDLGLLGTVDSWPASYSPQSHLISKSVSKTLAQWVGLFTLHILLFSFKCLHMHWDICTWKSVICHLSVLQFRQKSINADESRTVFLRELEKILFKILWFTKIPNVTEKTWKNRIIWIKKNQKNLLKVAEVDKNKYVFYSLKIVQYCRTILRWAELIPSSNESLQ
jgi:hypothetical protein